MDIGERQRKLSLWAEQDTELRFYDLYGLLYNQDWLKAAHASVSQNAGSATAGTDEINMYFFDNNFEENFGKLREELKAKTFEPDPVRRAYIPKSNGKWSDHWASRCILHTASPEQECWESLSLSPRACASDTGPRLPR